MRESKDDKMLTSVQGRELAQENVSGSVGDEIQAHIGDRLKAYYDNVLTEPVPDRFLELLAKLDEPGGPQSGGQG